MCDQFVFDVGAFGCSGIVADITKSTIASSMALFSVFSAFVFMSDFVIFIIRILKYLCIQIYRSPRKPFQVAQKKIQKGKRTKTRKKKAVCLSA